MKTLNLDLITTEKIFKEGSILILGIFDGVHKAHADLIEFGTKTAKKERLCSALLTFSENFNKGSYITSNSLKEKYIKELNCDYLIFQSLAKEFLNLSPSRFVELLKDKLNAKILVVGENYTFGKEKSGNAGLLKEICAEKGITVFVKELLKENNEVVSASLIKKELKDGNIKKANLLLGRNYEIEGVVEAGAKLGRTLGFPTVNIYPDGKMCLPKYGVYKTIVLVNNKEFYGITNVGIKPTAPDSRLSVETYIKDFSGDIYGEKITVKFLDFIREEKKFNSLDELKKQINEDLKK